MQGALAMAFVIEGLLFSFHLRGDLLDVEIHTLLVITIFLTAVVMFAEIQHKSNVLLSALRANLVLMQGVWFIQAAYILFRGNLRLTISMCPSWFQLESISVIVAHRGELQPDKVS